MGGPDRSEVALVECRDLRLDQPLRECDDAGIDDSEREIRIAGLQLAAAGKIAAGRRFDAVDASEQIVEEDEPGLGWESAAAPVVELGENESWYDQVFVRARQQPGAPLVIGIRGVEGGKQRTRVADQGHLSAAPRRLAPT
jgi:hypothetical protein